MEVVISPDAKESGRLAAQAISELVHDRADATLGVATGSSPQVIYDELARRCEAGELSLAACRLFMLDEYVGLPEDHPQLYRNVLLRELLSRTDLDPRNLHGPNGSATDIPDACDAYESAIRDAGGIDLQILGIGTDGHIAFNEPGSSLGSRTRIKTLTAQTRQDNARFFNGDVDAVPRHCLTQGIATIMEARHIVLIASGRGKSQAVHHLVEGPISAMWPATALQFHPHATVLLDPGAAGRLQLAEYFRESHDAKPDWQSF